MTYFSPARGTALLGIGCALSGVVGGVVWGMLAPGSARLVVAGGAMPLDSAGDHVFDALAIYVWVTAAVGLVAGAAAWTWHRMRGPATAAAVLIGSAAGAWIAAGAGGWIAQQRLGWPGADAAAGMIGQIVVKPPAVGLWVLLIAQPLAAGLAYFVGALLAPDAGLEAGAADGPGPRPPAAEPPAAGEHRPHRAERGPHGADGPS